MQRSWRQNKTTTRGKARKSCIVKDLGEILLDNKTLVSTDVGQTASQENSLALGPSPWLDNQRFLTPSSLHITTEFPIAVWARGRDGADAMVEKAIRKHPNIALVHVIGGTGGETRAHKTKRSEDSCPQGEGFKRKKFASSTHLVAAMSWDSSHIPWGKLSAHDSGSVPGTPCERSLACPESDSRAVPRNEHS